MAQTDKGKVERTIRCVHYRYPGGDWQILDLHDGDALSPTLGRLVDNGAEIGRITRQRIITVTEDEEDVTHLVNIPTPL